MFINHLYSPGLPALLGSIFILILISSSHASKATRRQGKSLENVFDFLTKFLRPLNETAAATSNPDVVPEIIEKVFLNEAWILVENSNLMDYTVAASFYFGAGFDTTADLILNERTLEESLGDKETLYLWMYLWGYAIGFAGPFFIGLESPYQDCGSTDLLHSLANHNLTLEHTITLSQTQLFLLTRSFRLEADKRLFCILSKTDRFPEATLVNSRIEEIVDLVLLYNTIQSKIESEVDFEAEVSIEDEQLTELSTSIQECDDRMIELWDSLESKVVAAYEYAYASRVNHNLIKVVIGIPNIIGMVAGALGVIESKDYSTLPLLADIPAVLWENIRQFIFQGRPSNDFFVSEALSINGHFSWGYGYTAPYFLALVNPEPGCGVIEFLDISRSYSEFRNFTKTFGSGRDIVSGSAMLSVNTVPSFSSYRLKRFGRELKTALHCLLSRKEEPAYELLFIIETWLDIALFRMDLTASVYSLLGRDV
ncbi:uncharacterized protein LOC111712904 isoform X2 [Eurytemora carolleeae]|uniref:uncharacterized protein LOC111712904 isoform X2 n=1 Tax=Eurytemora carolleeae TaxID=1294199 RepID=UPI000C78369E|nr:uncharacterized protein LOC111712904 isoform X2 [Eurytemora carolleeae]|eukprot:XP_023343425.1 uncharacterized protein LOC111712904 isoform X2 [Eurytemora affinis]